MKVGFYSPLPPARTGVADYAAALLKALRPLGEVEVDARKSDVALYQIGNNPMHTAIYRRALDEPGVAVLHDAVLHHFLLGTSNEREYIAEFVYNYGAWSEDLGRDLWRNRSRSTGDAVYFRYPMIKRIAERSLAVVVHNPAAAAMVRAHAPNAVIHEIPHLYIAPDPAPDASEVIRLRHRLGIGEHTFLFAVFGYLRASKRLAAVLRAFLRARSEADMALLIAGDFVSPDTERSVRPWLKEGAGIYRVGHTEEDEFWRYAAASDACINLRFPAAGETSGIATRFMGLGKPVLVSEGVETSRFPETTCLKVDTGPAEEEMVREFMVWLARFPVDARAIGRRAAEYIRAEHAPSRVGRLYWDALLKLV